MGKRILYISIILAFFLISHACGTVTFYPDKISGNGSFKRDYYISNDANDSAKVSLNIKNATYFEFNYKNYSNELQCGASMDLIVKHAESINCFSEAKSRYNNSSNIITIIKNGSIKYTNSAYATIHGVENLQEIIDASGDKIDIICSSLGESMPTSYLTGNQDIDLEYASGESMICSKRSIVNSIMASKCENFHCIQNIYLGDVPLSITKVNAIAGPLKVESFIGAGEREINSTADIVHGVISIDQKLNLNEVCQDSKGVIGGGKFEIAIAHANGNKIHLYEAVGSGNLIDLSQCVSGIGTNNIMEYEYMPTSYQTDIQDLGLAYASGESKIGSKINIVNSIMASNCEDLKSSQNMSFGDIPLSITKANATAGPLKVKSYIGAGEREINSTADVVHGIININQDLNLNEARQDSKGTIGGGKFETVIAHANRNKTHLYEAVGSGYLLDSSQRVSDIGTSNIMEYKYLPTSYQTGTQDLDLAYASGESKIGSKINIVNSIMASNCEDLKSSQNMSFGDIPLSITKANATAGPLKVKSYIGGGEREINSTADVVHGIININQDLNLNEARQDSKGTIGGGKFETVIAHANGNKTQLYEAVGSGYLLNSSQRVSDIGTSNIMEYEYFPTKYQTGTQDLDLAYASGESKNGSDRRIVNSIVASNCEHLKSSQNMSFGDIPLSIIKANATAGPLKVASYTAQSGRVLSATTDVAAGDLSIDQIIDLAGAQQALKGWVCGINSDTMAKYADGKETYANTMLGSGIMPNLFHQVSWKDARCNVEYKYSPVSYQTGTYDIKLNLSKVES